MSDAGGPVILGSIMTPWLDPESPWNPGRMHNRGAHIRQRDPSTAPGLVPGPIAVSIIDATSAPNVASVVTPALPQVIAALQKQVDEHFSVVWGIRAKLSLVNKGDRPPETSWWLVITDNSDQVGALGYHDLTATGLPLGFAFAGSDLVNKVSWTVTVSHELLEMLVDPYINLSVLIDDPAQGGVLFAYEVCDACEADQLGYEIDGILVSDFVFPSWFEPRPPHSARFDWRNAITEPLQLLPGGYIGINRVGTPFGWTQLTARNELTFDQRARVGSRRERRKVPKAHWLLSR